MAIQVDVVPHMSFDPGANEASEVVSSQFTTAQEYASNSMTTAEYYLETLVNTFTSINTPAIDIDYNFQEVEIESTLTTLRPTPPTDAEMTPETFEQPTRPTFDTVTIPSVTIPVYDIVDPATDFSYQDSGYSSTLNTVLKALMATYINDGGTGLGEDVEDALWARARARTELENERMYDEVDTYYAVRGHETPPGAHAGQILRVNAEVNRNNEQMNYEIMIEQARLAHEHTKFNITSALALEGQEKELYNNIQNRLLEAAKTLVDIVLTTYKTKVDGYISKLQAAQMELDVNKTQAEVIMESNKNLVAIYQSDLEAYKINVSTELGIIESIAKVYSYRVAGYESDAKAEATKLDAQIELYKAKISQANNQTMLSLKEAELTLQAYLGQMGLSVEGAKALANVSAQLAASALSSVNASASIGDSISRGLSKSHNHTESLGNSASLSETHQYPHAES